MGLVMQEPLLARRGQAIDRGGLLRSVNLPVGECDVVAHIAAEAGNDEAASCAGYIFGCISNTSKSSESAVVAKFDGVLPVCGEQRKGWLSTRAQLCSTRQSLAGAWRIQDFDGDSTRSKRTVDSKGLDTSAVAEELCAGWRCRSDEIEDTRGIGKTEGLSISDRRPHALADVVVVKTPAHQFLVLL